MKQPEPTRPIELKRIVRLNLKRIQAESPSVERLRAALRRNGRDPWTSPFAASGAKPPPIAPSKRLG